MTTVVCRMKPKAMTRAELRERIDLTENERNPKQSKHLETGKMRLCNQWLDFVQLRKEEADENSCVPKAVVLLLPLLCLFYNILDLILRIPMLLLFGSVCCIIYFTISKPFFAMICSSKPHCCRCTLLSSANSLLPMPLALSAPRAPYSSCSWYQSHLSLEASCSL
ncbi:hypothetical protein DY000_02057938 [Brassica cretica]|uniref:Uncharacterized protein n=1 Tax=Brassica cretica TaxID=69181 RepID=A0ABQ7AAP4_BRACR|nr:hypothetical protein DY000_02057938 [Brassica cretica]